MSDSLAAKQPGDQVRAKRPSIDERAIENDWTLVRFEPKTEKAVLEKNGKRVIAPREEFDALNFPGSDALWTILAASEVDDDLREAKHAWADADLSGVLSALIKHARTMDPAFAGVQTASDVTIKTKEQEDACRSSLEILRLDATRAKHDYDQYSAATPLEYDHKDNLLANWRNFDDQYAAHKFQCEKLVPAWRLMATALQALVKAINVS